MVVPSMLVFVVVASMATSTEKELKCVKVGASLGTNYRLELHFGFSAVSHSTFVLVTTKEM